MMISMEHPSFHSNSMDILSDQVQMELEMNFGINLDEMITFSNTGFLFPSYDTQAAVIRNNPQALVTDLTSSFTCTVSKPMPG
jgi:hypothetical protein